MTLTATSALAAGLSIGALAYLGYADSLVRLLAGPGDWDRAGTYLRILFLASCLRFLFLPWAILIVVRGEQRSIVLAPVIEAITNLLASVILGFWLGALGVVIGTLVGATVTTIYLTWGVRHSANRARPVRAHRCRSPGLDSPGR